MNFKEIKVCNQTFAVWMAVAKSVNPLVKPGWAYRAFTSGCPACEYHTETDGLCPGGECILNPIWGAKSVLNEDDEFDEECFLEGKVLCENSSSSPYKKWCECGHSEKEFAKHYALKIAWGAYQLGHDPNGWRDRV